MCSVKGYLVISLLLITACGRSLECDVGIESEVDVLLEGVGVKLDEMMVVRSAYLSPSASKYMYISARQPPSRATVHWRTGEGERQLQVLELSPAESCTEGMLVLRFVKGPEGIRVEKQVRPFDRQGIEPPGN
jgi:hypothetical protein